MKFSERLKQLRIEANLTQEELGEKLYVTRQAISNYEQGRGLPSIDTLCKISTLFNVSLDELLQTTATKRFFKHAIMAISVLCVSLFLVALATSLFSDPLNTTFILLIYVIPVVTLILGIVFECFPPQKINGVIGYRTKLSMSNQTMWNLAQGTLGKCCTLVAIACIITCDLFLIVVMLINVQAVPRYSWILTIFHALSLIVPIIVTNKTLKKVQGSLQTNN